jgi:hypothetical protein
MNPAYYDANYLVKLQINEGGSTEVQLHATTVSEIKNSRVSPISRGVKLLF